MHGFIFVTWERYLADRFGPRLLEDYRAKPGETGKNTPLIDRRYDDATLLAGLETATRLTALPLDALLLEYGRYFLLNGLTHRLCSYLLNQVQSGLDLLLVMRNAHAQIGSAAGITPPLFRYEQTPGDPDGLVLLYDSPRKLCSLPFCGPFPGSGLSSSGNFRAAGSPDDAAKTGRSGLFGPARAGTGWPDAQPAA